MHVVTIATLIVMMNITLYTMIAKLGRIIILIVFCDFTKRCLFSTD